MLGCGVKRKKFYCCTVFVPPSLRFFCLSRHEKEDSGSFSTVLEDIGAGLRFGIIVGDGSVFSPTGDEGNMSPTGNVSIGGMSNTVFVGKRGWWCDPFPPLEGRI